MHFNIIENFISRSNFIEIVFDSEEKFLQNLMEYFDYATATLESMELTEMICLSLAKIACSNEKLLKNILMFFLKCFSTPEKPNFKYIYYCT